jgi:hypothetical protein
LLRDRPNGARGQRRRQKRRAFRRKPVPSDCIATRTRDAWSTRTVLDSTSRSDLERSPLHDVKQHTPARRTWAGRESLSLLDEQTGRCKRAVLLRSSLAGGSDKNFCRAGDFTPEPEQKRMPDRKLSKLPAISRTPWPTVGSQPPIWWSQTGSNRRPPACKAGALPTELWPLRGSVIRRQ